MKTFTFWIMVSIPIFLAAEDTPFTVDVDIHKLKTKYEEMIPKESRERKLEFKDRSDALDKLRKLKDEMFERYGFRSKQYKEVKERYDEIRKDSDWKPDSYGEVVQTHRKPLKWDELKIGDVGHFEGQGKLRSIQVFEDGSFLGELEYDEIRRTIIVGGKANDVVVKQGHEHGPYIFRGLNNPKLNQDDGWVFTHTIKEALLVTKQVTYTTVGGGQKTVFQVEAFDPQKAFAKVVNDTTAGKPRQNAFKSVAVQNAVRKFEDSISELEVLYKKDAIKLRDDLVKQLNSKLSEAAEAGQEDEQKEIRNAITLYQDLDIQLLTESNRSKKSTSETIVGRWRFHTGVDVTFDASGAIINRNDRKSGFWKLSDKNKRIYELHWANSIDTCQLSTEGKVLEGTTTSGGNDGRVWAVRLD